VLPAIDENNLDHGSGDKIDFFISGLTSRRKHEYAVLRISLSTLTVC
jgi:hypothetical protein